MRVGFIATICRNITRGVFLFEDNEDSIVLVTNPKLHWASNLCWWVQRFILVKAGCLNSRQAQIPSDSSLALPDWMLQGRLMARIQFDVITILVKKLLFGHTRSISSPILRWGNFTQAIFFYSVWQNLLFMMGKDFVQITLWYTKTTHDNPLCEAPTTLIPWRPPQIRYWINNDIVHYTSN